jgi:hypothetical protein
VRAEQGKARLSMIDRRRSGDGRHPDRRAVAFLAAIGEPDELMRRFRRRVEGLLVASDALERHVFHIASDVASRALERGVPARQRELRTVVVESRRFPGVHRMALRAAMVEGPRRVVGGLDRDVIFLMTVETFRRRVFIS